jgi:hypothetical protein
MSIFRPEFAPEVWLDMLGWDGMGWDWKLAFC